MSQYVNDERVGEDLSEQQLASAAQISDKLDLNLVSDPFSSVVSNDFFGGAERQTKLEELVHLCQFGNSLVAVLGDTGVGKTRLLEEAQLLLVETSLCCMVTASVMSTAEEVFQQISSQLKLPISSSASAGEILVGMRNAMSEGQINRVVIIVDDAHHLNDQILSALVSLLQGQGHQLHILVSGDQALVERFDQFQMVDVLIYDINLEPFSFSETKEYLDFKLAAANYPQDLYFEDEQVKQITRGAKGYPAAINEAARTLLFRQDIDSEDDIKAPGLPLLHMALLVVLLAALIMALFYMGGDDELALDQAPPPQINIESESIDAAPIVELKSVEPKPDEGAAPSQQKIVTVESPQSVASGSLPQTEQALSAVEGRPSETNIERQALKPLDIIESESEPPKPITNEPVPVSSEPPSSGLSASLKEELAKEVEQLAKESSNVVGSSSQLSKREQQVLSWSDSSYALQVIGASQSQNLQQFIDAQPNSQDLYLLGIGRDGEPWYVVITGPYLDRQQAREAIQRLPQNQVNAKPWARQVGDLKQKIKAFRNK